ncbi:hypothetical protein MXAN_5401 [Myxococcus xanthus DK 1622]|uniref:Uncharacterized protein n=1 Tax=Myxococcus xanthus (strain DK1622) TaxID=246197 RepID=Q1D1C5_MYXXD|nr:hypothetical protein MXAN_5401 [Myxococcus xanthus DK 1622]
MCEVGPCTRATPGRGVLRLKRRQEDQAPGAHLKGARSGQACTQRGLKRPVHWTGAPLGRPRQRSSSAPLHLSSPLNRAPIPLMRKVRGNTCRHARRLSHPTGKLRIRQDGPVRAIDGAVRRDTAAGSVIRDRGAEVVQEDDPQRVAWGGAEDAAKALRIRGRVIHTEAHGRLAELVVRLERTAGRVLVRRRGDDRRRHARQQAGDGQAIPNGVGRTAQRLCIRPHGGAVARNAIGARVERRLGRHTGDVVIHAQAAREQRQVFARGEERRAPVHVERVVRDVDLDGRRRQLEIDEQFVVARRRAIEEQLHVCRLGQRIDDGTFDGGSNAVRRLALDDVVDEGGNEAENGNDLNRLTQERPIEARLGRIHPLHRNAGEVRIQLEGAIGANRRVAPIVDIRLEFEREAHATRGDGELEAIRVVAVDAARGAVRRPEDGRIRSAIELRVERLAEHVQQLGTRESDGCGDVARLDAIDLHHREAVRRGAAAEGAPHGDGDLVRGAISQIGEEYPQVVAVAAGVRGLVRGVLGGIPIAIGIRRRHDARADFDLFDVRALVSNELEAEAIGGDVFDATAAHAATLGIPIRGCAAADIEGRGAHQRIAEDLRSGACVAARILDRLPDDGERVSSRGERLGFVFGETFLTTAKGERQEQQGSETAQ